MSLKKAHTVFGFEALNTPRNSRVVNFEAAHTHIGSFVDVKIVDVYTNSLRGEFVRGEDEMDLRRSLRPSDILAKHKTDDDLGVTQFTPN
jgi:tRNA-2-methylthio-N6-dimethylallyladenosine synthase